MRLAQCLTPLVILLIAAAPSPGLAEPSAESPEAARAKLPALRAASERTGRAKDRVALALALEQAGDRDGALAEAFGIVTSFAERGARGKANSAALSAALDLVERVRVSREAAPVALTLPAGCERPTVRMGDTPVEVRNQGQSITALLPPNAGVTTEVTIECGAGSEADDLGPEVDWAPYLFGGAGVSAAAALFFTARFLSADSDLETPEPIVDPRELGPEAQRLTRARQSRDDFGTAAVMMGVLAAGLAAGGVYFSLGEAPVTAAPAVGEKHLGLSLGGRF